MNARAREFGPGGEERAATNRLRFGPRFGRRARVLGPAGFAVCGALPASPGVLPILITTAVSVRARWKKGLWAAVGKRLSQLSFSVYAGQVVFREAQKKDDDLIAGDETIAGDESLATGRRFF